jgi:OOP family OmpA-OmpF porin
LSYSINFLLLMKHLNVLIATILFLSTTHIVAQTADDPWQIGLSFNAVDVYPTGAEGNDPFAPQGDFFEDVFNFSDHWNFGGPSVSLSRSVYKGFSVGARVSINLIKKIDGLDNVEYPYFAAGGFLKQTFASSKKVRPFITVGYGISDFDYSNNRKFELLSSNTSRNINGGIGFDFKLFDFIGLSIESTFHNPLESTGVKHFRHQLGLFYAFGEKDTDKDGIKDKDDECPEEPGLKEFNGCPDTDGDKIPDNKDECPEEVGTEMMNGCPDADEDGIADKDDECQQEKGSIALNGCPDTDGDGVADKNDKCPDEVGAPENEGCPWPDTDGDGVNDIEDACPEEKGTPENSGCPELSKEIISSINELADKILFASETERLQGASVFRVLNEIKSLLELNPDGKLIIEGHASSDGSSEYNAKLSEQRANAVREYLIKMGISADRLRVESFGEDKPANDNDTSEGRALNRRVQFRADF